MSMLRPLNVATPLVAVCESVPESVPLFAPSFRFRVTPVEESVVTVFPFASSRLTATEKDAPAAAPAGWGVNASAAGLPGVTTKEVLVPVP